MKKRVNISVSEKIHEALKEIDPNANISAICTQAMKERIEEIEATRCPYCKGTGRK